MNSKIIIMKCIDYLSQNDSHTREMMYAYSLINF